MNTLKNSIAIEGLTKLFCHYLNCTLTSRFRAPLFGGDWDMPVRFMTAYTRMTNTIENDIMPRTDEERDINGYKMYEPPGTTGLGMPMVGPLDEMNGAVVPYLATETLGNVLRVSVRQHAPGNLIQFPFDMIGSMIVRTCAYYFSLTHMDGEIPARPGFTGELGPLDIALSSDISSLRYTPAGGDPVTISEGGLYQIRGGVLHSNAAVTGVYNIELIGLSSPNNDLRQMFQHYPSYVDAFRSAMIALPPTLQPLFIQFLRTIGNGQVNDPIHDAPFIIASQLAESEIRNLTKVLCAVTAMS